MVKSLNGAEIADYMKENQAHLVRSLKSRKVFPKLVIIRDNDSPVIRKYVNLKQRYGQDIGVEVEDWLTQDLEASVKLANDDPSVYGIIIQLPLIDPNATDSLVNKIRPEKDVDGLSHGVNIPKNTYSSGDIKNSEKRFESATATAIHWLLNGYGYNLKDFQIAIVGRGRLVGGPLSEMWQESGYNVKVFRSHDDLSMLKNYDLIVTATGVPHLIKSNMVQPGAIIVDAGTASEGGILVGDVDDAVRERNDLSAITPKTGGVGPLTVTALFEHVLIAVEQRSHVSGK